MNWWHKFSQQQPDLTQEQPIPTQQDIITVNISNPTELQQWEPEQQQQEQCNPPSECQHPPKPSFKPTPNSLKTSIA